MDCSTVVRIKTLHISSPILAAKSPFFYKVTPPPPPPACSSTIALHFFSIKYMDVNFFHLSTLTFFCLFSIKINHVIFISFVKIINILNCNNNLFIYYFH
jgi:hypothetical protein